MARVELSSNAEGQCECLPLTIQKQGAQLTSCQCSSQSKSCSLRNIVGTQHWTQATARDQSLSLNSKEYQNPVPSVKARR